MDLFAADAVLNLLPCDGTVHYHGPVMGAENADAFQARLLQMVPWKSDEVLLFGKRIVTARKVAWYGDAAFPYTYSATTKQALPWNEALRELKSLVEQLTGASFNSCLLNLYHDGNEGMGWHSDNEKMLVRNGVIASLSLGAERTFSFKHKQAPHTVSVALEHGSLLVMKDATQTHWVHRLPKSKKVRAYRINLTFRSIVVGD